MASGMITSIGGSGDTLDRLHDMVEEERDKAAGRVRVARDSLDTSGVEMKETEQKALADQALADFAAKEGIALDLPRLRPPERHSAQHQDRWGRQEWRRPEPPSPERQHALCCAISTPPFWSRRRAGLGRVPVNALGAAAFGILGFALPAFWLLGHGA